MTRTNPEGFSLENLWRTFDSISFEMKVSKIEPAAETAVFGDGFT